MEIFFFSSSILATPLLLFFALSLCDSNRTCILDENVAKAEPRKHTEKAAFWRALRIRKIKLFTSVEKLRGNK